MSEYPAKRDLQASEERIVRLIADIEARSDECFAAMDERFATMQRVTRLSAAQLVTEEKFQGLLDALRRGENGHN